MDEYGQRIVIKEVQFERCNLKCPHCSRPAVGIHVTGHQRQTEFC
jgi:transposase-like protein